MKIAMALAMTLAVAAALPGAAPAAGKHDGSSPLLCAPTLVTECSPEGACERTTPEAVNLPTFLRADLAAQKVTRSRRGGSRRSATSSTSAATSAEGAGFVVFGSCIVP